MANLIDLVLIPKTTGSTYEIPKTKIVEVHIFPRFRDQGLGKDQDTVWSIKRVFFCQIWNLFHLHMQNDPH